MTTINIDIDRKFSSNFSGYSPAIKIEAPDRRFDKPAVKKAIEEKVNDMLVVDLYRVSGRAMVEVDEEGCSYYATFQEKFEIVIDFVEMTGRIIFKSSNRGYSRMI